MKRSLMYWTTTLAAILAVASCVTVNVYFPEAQAEQAASKFIGGVWGGDGQPPADQEQGEPPMDNPRSSLLDFLIPAAYAQDVSISTPAVEAIQSRMRDRFSKSLRDYYESGAIGLTNNALVAVRDLSAVPLSGRNKLNQLVAEENADRKAVYREIAVANEHPEWEDRIRDIFARKWIDEARPGWWYQNDAGGWVQK